MDENKHGFVPKQEFTIGGFFRKISKCANGQRRVAAFVTPEIGLLWG